MKYDPRPLRIDLLGPLSLRLNEIAVTISAPKQRQVMALLALNAGNVVTLPMFIEELWGERPPRSYATTLQTYILQLRNTLAANSSNLDVRQILSTCHCSYLLDEDACHTDIEIFDRLVRAGRVAAEASDYHQASEQFNRALQLWRGPALVDVRIGRVLEIETASLEERRLGALERHIEADLVLGRHTDLLGELMLVTARNPMNENLYVFLMTALYRAGHVGRSLEAFHRVRSVLDHELGVEPCRRLKRLQAAILSRDPALEAWSVPVGAGSPRLPGTD
jgi:DNA-binding SARP family transcriptional activator